jgi:hypothetical protein
MSLQRNVNPGFGDRGMAIRRKDALKTLQGLAPQVDAHLEKIAAKPGHSSLSKWKGEIRTWLQQMEDLLPHVGKKTATAWQERLERYHEALGS